MGQRHYLTLFICFLLPLALEAQPASPGPISDTARSYLNQALDIMEQHSVHRKTVDWSSLRAKTLEHAAGAETPADTYEAIRFALRSLGDHHSFLQLSGDLVEKDKAARQKRQDAPPATAGGEKWPPSPYFNRDIPEGMLKDVDGTRIAVLVVPKFGGSDKQCMDIYAHSLQSAITNLAAEKPDGWIVDLRGNLGGNMWPMVDGLGALLGEETLGFFVDSEGLKDSWSYGADGAGINHHDGKREAICRVPAQDAHFAGRTIIAVLIDRGTASSGEATAISFEGRPLTRFFGRHTHGESSANDGFALPDGANLVLTTGLESDRTGHVYADGIAPDVELPEETALPAPGTIDPMTKAAAAWIRSMQIGNASASDAQYDRVGSARDQ
jgi:carboxyl-terminal processing protease